MDQGKLTDYKLDADGDLSLESEPERIVEKSGLQSAAELKEFNRKQQEAQNKKLME